MPGPDAALDHIIERVKEASQDQLKIYVNTDDVTLQPLNFSDLPFAQELAHILVSGDEIEIDFKSHFMLNEAEKLTCRKLRLESVTERQSIDFMKEYCNIVAGKMKSMLEAVEITMGQSLPFVMQGYNEMFYPEQGGTTVHDAWKIHAEGVTLNCSVRVNLREPAIVDLLMKTSYAAEYGAAAQDVELF